MNRLSHIRETLPKNIHDNKSFPQIEFLLLDYNSADGLEDWVRMNMMDHIRSGVLKYFRTTEPSYFSMSHSKNMASNLSSGDVLCMIDADIYAGFNYAFWVDSVFSRSGPNTVVTHTEKDCLSHGDLGGKQAYHKEFFTQVRGFDESMSGYGMDDMDMVNRLVKAGGTRVFIRNKEYSRYISHSTEDRLKNYWFINNLECMYILKAADIEVRNVILYLMKDDTYYMVTYKFDSTLLNDKTLSMGGRGWAVHKDDHKKGKIEKMGNGLMLDGEFYLYMSGKGGPLASFDGNKQEIWERVPDDRSSFINLIMSFSDCLNRIRYQENDTSQRTVNPQGWGKGTAFLNFDYNVPIHV
jgi:hypothetical protein